MQDFFFFFLQHPQCSHDHQHCNYFLCQCFPNFQNFILLNHWSCPSFPLPAILFLYFQFMCQTGRRLLSGSRSFYLSHITKSGLLSSKVVIVCVGASYRIFTLLFFHHYLLLCDHIFIIIVTIFKLQRIMAATLLTPFSYTHFELYTCILIQYD